MTNRSSTMTDAKVELARKTWWNSVCRKGDPQRRPHLATEAFEAGWNAALEQPDAARPELANKLLALKPFLEAHHCSTEVIDEAVAVLQSDAVMGEAGDAEDTAWAWLESYARERHGEAPEDVSGFSSDQMVDAFIAGIERSTPIAPVQDDVQFTADSPRVEATVAPFSASVEACSANQPVQDDEGTG